MSVLYPSTLWWFLILIPLGILQIVHLQRSRRNLERIGGAWSAPEANHVFFVKWLISTVFLLLFVSGGILSLSGLSWGDAPVEEDRSQLDLVFAVDVSRSMLSQDLPPSRMQVARDIVRGLVQEFQSARYALLAFSGSPLSMIPMTEDGYAMEHVLSYLGPGLLSSPGTNIQTALEAAVGAFPQGSNRHRVIILLTDGESLTGSLEAVVPRLERSGIPVLAVALGSVQGGTIPLGDSGPLLHPQTGEPVVTRVNTEALKQLAGVSDSGFIHIDGSTGYAGMSEYIRGIEQTRNMEGFRLQRISRHSLMMGVSLIFLLGYILTVSLRFRRIL